MTRRAQPERQLQIAVAQYLTYALPPDWHWTALDHSGVGKKRGAQHKAMGVKKGTLDVYIWVPQLACRRLVI